MPVITAAQPPSTTLTYKAPSSNMDQIRAAVAAVAPPPAPATQPVGQDPIVEAVKAEAAASPEAKAPGATPEQLSRSLAAMARRERAVREEKRQIQAQLDALKSKEPEYSSALGLKDRLIKNPIGTLNELGITYEQLVNQVINQTPDNPEFVKLKAEIQEERKALKSELDKRFEEAQKNSYEQAVAQIKADVETLVGTSDKPNEQYELIAKTGSSEAVAEYIRMYYDEYGKLLSLEEAANEVENHLVSELTGIASAKKIQAKFQPKVETPQPIPPQQPIIPKQTQTQFKTLTNAAMPQTQRLTERDRIQRAILAFQGRLPQQ